MIMQKYKKHKNHFEKDQQSSKSFDNLYKKGLQNILIDKNEHQSRCNLLLSILIKQKMNLF